MQALEIMHEEEPLLEPPTPASELPAPQKPHRYGVLSKIPWRAAWKDLVAISTVYFVEGIMDMATTAVRKAVKCAHDVSCDSMHASAPKVPICSACMLACAALMAGRVSCTGLPFALCAYASGHYHHCAYAKQSQHHCAYATCHAPAATAVTAAAAHA